MLKKLSKGIGSVVESTISGSGRLVSKGVEKVGFKQTADFIDETTELVGKVSNAGFALTGQTIQGAYQVGKGLLTKDTDERDEGVEELTDVTKKVAKGIVSTVKVGARNTYETGAGLLTKDYERAKEGALNLAKLGIVAATAISIIDLIDGPDVAKAEEIQAFNAHLVGDVHPVTGVPFEINTVEHNGMVIQDVFPVFDTDYSVQLPENAYLESDYSHFSYANEQLYQSLAVDPTLASNIGLSEADIQGLAQNETPDGYVWHHHEEPGVLQLVNEAEHNGTAHTGGRFIWGGGSEYR